MDIILASQSPRRKELLSQMGLRGFKVTSPEVDETVEEHLPPAQVVEELSRRKALAVARHADQDDLIIAADTVVALEGAVLGKPADQREAFAMLTALSGNRHYVYTGLTVIKGDQVMTQHECTTVTFRDLEPEEISHYIATGEPMDKAGAYGIQGLGAMLVSGIEGDYFNVVGLPIFRLSRILAGFGLDLFQMADH
ncbi:septum formation inhibitor Maf [Pseudoflavonifractor capillosus]|uniref:Maf family protein n=1 Tax=Pseudoflavonifractor capillosus TaxID=106588 RepID=UPI00195D19D5|nr:Maf family protein [Pseudoflavonifractor capillosus]MBM6897638.1 septum formation inhibitor Maf [Pseudoflavonifractor capillosus]